GVSNLIPFALSGGETFTLTGEDYLHIDSAYIDAGDAIALEGMTVLASASAYSNFLRNYDLLEAYDANAALEAVLEATRYDDVSGVKVDGDTGKLTFTGGQYDENLAISAGNDVHGEDGEAIVNPGQAAMASIDFSANDADYPQLTNL